ncbi:DUF2339 domain-containing protein [Chelativorans salis]|uniref:DUF2339 domain-containing protein n=1 Tax=Chelativorans salis TaxID=2978478 RepID=A0ABT2LH93_9HYPH|nr:DUF2339 domain-containing protein [Chelativorans sp. EGI FJ00035]MCT7373682.1 DUF2339 domain-containing protein [Chelativorans sp. EGI FJ00035]
MGVRASARTRRLELRLQSVEGELQELIRGGGDRPSAPAKPEEMPWEPSDDVVDETVLEERKKHPGKGSVPSVQKAASVAAEPPADGVREDEPEVPRPQPQSLEERIGTRWAVWVGGLALVLGGIFLVRYSIEAGLMTPAARISSGALLALVLVGAGEWLRRRSLSGAAEVAEGAPYIPGVLTLAGTTTAFATVFAAHALYGMVGPGPAFLLFAAVALMTLVAAVLHGRAVASYGLIASYIIPFLVHSDQPAVWPLALYGIFVSLAAYGVARVRLWLWLAFAAAGGALFWGHVLAFASGGPWDAGALAVYSLAVFAMAAFVFVISLYPRNAGDEIERQDWAAALVLFLHAFLIIYLLQIDGFGSVSLSALVVVAAALLVIATEWPAAAAAAIGAAVLMTFAYLSWQVPLSPVDLQQHVAAASRIAAALANPSAENFTSVGLLLAALSGCMGLWGTLRSSGRWALAAAGAATPLALLAIAYLRVAPFETSVFFGALSLILAAAFLAALVFLDRRLPADGPGREAALAAYTVGTVGAIAAGMAILLEQGWLPVGLALLAAGTMWVREKWPLPALSWVSLGVSVLTCLVIAYEPTIVGVDRLGRTPVFNALLYGYGVPTLAFGYCAWSLGRTVQDWVQQAFEALAIFAALVAIAVLIHHAMNGGDFYAPADTLREWSLHTLVLLAGALAAQRLDRISHSPVLSFASLAFGIVSFATIAQFHLFTLNPLFTGEPIGRGLVFNLLFVAYLLPACLCAAIALWTGAERPQWYRLAAGWLGGALIFVWISLEVRAYFHRPHLDRGVSTDAELYSYSAAWLLFGIALLLVGLRWQSRMIRLASAVFVLAAVAKVFLFDMAGLDGVWRALSFIGLGIVLIGIGLLYQRLLTRASANPPEPEERIA